MPVRLHQPNSCFITTEFLDKNGEAAERLVFQAVREAFSNRDCLGFCPYPIFIPQKQQRYEPDILLVDRELGAIVIEVKAIRIHDIDCIQGYQWQMMPGFYTPALFPYYQAENQLWALLGYCDRYPILKQQVTGRVIVALPYITSEQWQQRGFDQLLSCPPILFQDQLTPMRLSKALTREATILRRGLPLKDDQWAALLKVTTGRVPLNSGGNGENRAFPPDQLSRAEVISHLHQWTADLDATQIRIGWEIPPGAQRIRGIAGSGKTVLLAQKAAFMHWLHPDWDIALVFFTRSLYHQVLTLLTDWLAYFSNGELQYDPKQSRLKILHAWGEKEEPGLYSVARNACGVNAVLSERMNPDYNPVQKLIWNCKRLLEQQQGNLPLLFDAILIDEGQDLAVDLSELKFEGKQPFYWMSYQLCIFLGLRQGQLSNFGTGFSPNFGRVISSASTGEFGVDQIACEITFAPNNNMSDCSLN